jgi:large subunit ribosomal protein L30
MGHLARLNLSLELWLRRSVQPNVSVPYFVLHRPTINAIATFVLETVAFSLPTEAPLELIMSYFRITLMRSAIGLPARTANVLDALGLRKRMATVFHPVSSSVAGQIMKVKELVAVSEVDKPMTKREVHEQRVPDPGFYIESSASDAIKKEVS